MQQLDLTLNWCYGHDPDSQPPGGNVHTVKMVIVNQKIVIWHPLLFQNIT
jgi:hypothetical protein